MRSRSNHGHNYGSIPGDDWRGTSGGLINRPDCDCLEPHKEGLALRQWRFTVITGFNSRV